MSSTSSMPSSSRSLQFLRIARWRRLFRSPLSLSLELSKKPSLNSRNGPMTTISTQWHTISWKKPKPIQTYLNPYNSKTSRQGISLRSKTRKPCQRTVFCWKQPKQLDRSTSRQLLSMVNEIWNPYSLQSRSRTISVTCSLRQLPTKGGSSWRAWQVIARNLSQG